MEWVRENWIFILLLFICIAMHFFGHGRHGNHAGHDEKSEEHKEHADKKGGHGCC